MNHPIASELHNEISTRFRLSMESIYQLTPDQLNIILGNRKSDLDNIINEARQLSFKMQHEIVTCNLSVTVVPRSPDNLGTFSFGLRRTTASEEFDLIKARGIPQSVFDTLRL